MGLQENLRKQLALAVRSIQWSYAIFWSISSTQPGVLTWGDGYYNGDIKTRKTTQASEFNADQLGLQRSDLLRELYDSLSTEESNAQIRRPSASLSPEDLTDTEWYYLVCMSFVFNIGQGLPGKTLANGKPIWLCNAHYADSKLFCRSLLAKSAAIQTVVCFPFAGGVIELGITERVFEDPGLIQHVQASFLEIPHPYASVSTLISINALDDENLIQTHLDRGILNTDFNAIVGCDEVNVCSPSDGTNRYRLNNQTEESFMIEGGLTEGASQIESLQLMEGNENDGVHDSMSSSECIFPFLVDPEKANPVHKGEKENEFYQDQIEQTPTGIQVDDVHYQSVLSNLLKTSHKLMMGPYFQNFDKDSSFICWKKEGFMEIEMLQMENSQRLLKKVLFQVARVHNGPLLDSREDHERKDGICAPQLDEIDSNHVLAERKRRERISERFFILESLVPSTSKVDKVSILDNTIEYIKELGKRVEGLESCKDFVALESRTRRKSQCIAEKSCDNYGHNNRPVNREKPLVNKRKASDIGEFEPETSCFSVKDNSNDDVTVSVMEKDCLIEIRCPWRECLLLQIIDTISRLHLDSHSVQSNNNDGTLSMTIKSKLKNSTVASAEIIKQALQRVVNKC